MKYCLIQSTDKSGLDRFQSIVNVNGPQEVLHLLLHCQVGARPDIVEGPAALPVPFLGHNVAASPDAGKQLLRLHPATSLT
jgi:hypothetical protein